MRAPQTSATQATITEKGNGSCRSPADRLGQDHHDIALVAADGTVIAQRRIGNDAAGFAELLAMLAEHDSPDGHDQTRAG